MFNWLKRKRQQSSQFSEDDYKAYLEMQRQIAEAKEMWAEQKRAEEIVQDFAAFKAKGCDFIPDERTLPHPKDVIRWAFRKRIDFCEKRCCMQPNNSEWKRDLEHYVVGNIHLSDFQAIDPEDEENVRAANEMDKLLKPRLDKCQTSDQKMEQIRRSIASGELSPEAMRLQVKYFSRSVKEDH